MLPSDRSDSFCNSRISNLSEEFNNELGIYKRFCCCCLRKELQILAIQKGIFPSSPAPSCILYFSSGQVSGKLPQNFVHVQAMSSEFDVFIKVFGQK